MTTGHNIGELAKKNKINLHQLSKMAGVSYNTLYSIVRRKSDKVDHETVRKIALALGVHPMEIYGDSALDLIDYGMDLFARALETPGAQALKKINENSAVNTLGRLYTQDKKQEVQLDRILYAFSQLNEEGKEEAAKRIDELAEIPRYRRTEP